MITVVGKNVKKIARGKHIDDKTISEALNWDEKTTEKFLTKGRTVTVPELKALSVLLGVNTGELLFRKKLLGFNTQNSKKFGDYDETD